MTAAHVALLVNNIPDHAVSYGRALTEHGFRVHLVRSGKDALQLVRSGKDALQLVRSGKDALQLVRRTLPACVVIDLRLPDMS